MSQPDKASEPSMDEILASIRKIIAEDPAAGKAPTAAQGEPRLPLPMRERAHVLAAMPAPKMPPLPPQPASAPEPKTAQPPPVRPSQTITGRSGDQNALNLSLLEEDLADLVEDRVAASADAKPSPTPIAGARVEATEVRPRPAVAAAPSAVIPASNGHHEPGTDWRLARPAPASAPSAVPPSESASALANGVNDALAMFARPPAKTEQPSGIGFGIGNVPPPQSKPADPRPAQVAAPDRTGGGSAGTSSPPIADAAPPAIVPAPPRYAGGNGEDSVIAAVETAANIATAPALDALAASLAAPAASSQAKGRPASVAQSAPQAAAPAAAKPRPAPPAAVIAKPAAAQQVAPAKTGAPPRPSAAGEAMPGIPVRSMEDTVSELLRPMLRQWLDNNMPRIVEKALRVEMAGMADKTGDKPPQD